MISDAIRAVCKTIGTLYSSYPIYINAVSKSSGEPFFYLDVIPSISDGLNNRVNIDILFSLTYHTPYHDTNTILGYMDMAVNIQSALENFSLGTEPYRAYDFEIESDSQDKKYKMTFTVTISGFRQEQATDLIEEIELDINI